MIGIGVLAYYGLPDVQRCLPSIQQHTVNDYHLLLFDNSEDTEIREWVSRQMPEVEYVRSPYNVGCTVSRNRMAARFAQLGVRHFVVLDEDVEVVATAWDAEMLAIFGKYPDTGIVGWELANRSMGPRHARDETGVVPELPGMCNMYSMGCVRSVGGWCEEYFFYRWDTDFCLTAATKGYLTRVVNPDGGHDGVAHNHPHRGTARNQRAGQIKRRSQAIFDRRKKELGFAGVGF